MTVLRKYYWFGMGPLIFLAAFGNLASGVMAFGYAALLKVCITALVERDESASLRPAFYAFLALEIAIASFCFVVFGQRAIDYLPYALVPILLYWLIHYRTSGDGRRERDLLWQRELLSELRLKLGRLAR